MSNENLPPSAFYGNIPTIPDHIPQAGKKVVSKMESTTDGWISIKDRLPEEDSRGISKVVIAYYADGRVRDHYTHKGVWWQPRGEITHWMPLPEPPNVKNRTPQAS